MSRRSGGGGGRRGDNRRDQPSPAPAQSFQRGGGGDLAGRGRGGGRGGGREGSTSGGRGRGRGSYAGASEALSIPQASPPVPPTSTAAPAPSPSFQRGGGREGSISGGRGRGSYAGASEAVSIPQASPPVPSTSTAALAPAPAPAPAPARVPQPASASGSSSTMIQEMDKKLTLADPTEAVLPMSSKARRPPMRPGYGTVGAKCMVRANHFLVEVADRDIHHYDVSISPEVTSKKVNRDVLAQLTRLYSESHLDKRIPAYDGMKSLYTAGPLPFESKEFMVILEQDSSGSSSNSTRKERKFKVTIKLASKPDLYTLQQFLRRRHMDAPYEVVQVLDVVLRASPSEKHVVVGRSFFSPNLGPMGELGDGIEYWRGFYQSLRPTQMGLSFNTDISARGFYEPILVSEFVAKYINRNSSPLPDQDRVKVRKSLKGIKVALTHMDYAKSYKITGVSSQPLSQLTFTLDDQVTRTSVVQYFREKYNVVLKFTYLPALQAGSEAKPIYLPMELARIVEGQRYSKRLNERQVTALLRATCQRPFERESNIRKMVLANNYNGDKVVKEFGIHVGDEPTLVDARVLPPPMLNYHATGREKSVNPSLGQWNMINKRMINGGRVEFWTCVCFSTRLNRDFPFQFCEELVNMCISKGMEFNPDPLIPIISASPGQIERVLTDVHRKSTTEIARRGQHGKQLQLLIIILPDLSGSYGKIKRVCETSLGIVTQCCAPKQAQKFSKQYFENVSLKINVKVGGRNTVLNDAILRRIPHVSVQPTIIFGADVTHPQPGEDSSPSIAAVVASMDWPEVTKYRGIFSAQTHRDEIIKDLYTCQQDAQKGLVHGGMIRELLRAFRLSTGHKPYKIIFYRDGVSEGQFNQVLLHEVDAIRQACTSLEPDYMPPITFIVVQKRHHTRLFPADHGNRSMTDRSGNILPGTVVDTKICHPSEFDFYLNSHAGIQGTSRPTHYHVLFDENNFSANELQVLTNNLCYTYARCTRSVSIVPPAYYAHLAAFRARYYIEGDASDGGSSSGPRGTRERNLEVQSLPSIKENVKDVMFFC